MDNHFKNETFEKNIPVVLALLSVWYNNFHGSETHAIIPYSEYLNICLLTYNKQLWKVMAKV